VTAFFLELLANALALGLGQVVNEQLAIKVIDFVLDADREKGTRMWSARSTES
jgi:hypothetical protein